MISGKFCLVFWWMTNNAAASGSEMRSILSSSRVENPAKIAAVRVLACAWSDHIAGYVNQNSIGATARISLESFVSKVLMICL